MTRKVKAGSLSYSFIEEIVGRARFRDEWIQDLTHREKWLLERDAASRDEEPASIIRARMTSMNTATGRPFEDPSEYGQAKRRSDFMEWQRRGVLEWLETNNVAVSVEGHRKIVDKAQFELAFERAFPNFDASSKTQRATVDTPTGSSSAGSEIDGKAMARIVVEAIKADGRQLTRKAFKEMAGELIKPRPSGPAFADLWGELVPDEWREQGQGALPTRRRVEDWRAYLPKNS